MNWFWMAVSLFLALLLVITVIFACALVMWWESVEQPKPDKANEFKTKGLSRAELRRTTIAAQRFDRHLTKLKNQNMRVKYRSR